MNQVEPRVVDFLTDTMILLVEYAKEAKNDSNSFPDDMFKRGISFGYYEVLHLLQQQAESFAVPLESINLPKTPAEEMMLGLKLAPGE